MTIIDALTKAGATKPQADLSRVRIIRNGINDSFKPTKTEYVDVSAILQGRAPDQEVQSGDVIYVPQSPNKRGWI